MSNYNHMTDDELVMELTRLETAVAERAITKEKLEQERKRLALAPLVEDYKMLQKAVENPFKLSCKLPLTLELNVECRFVADDDYTDFEDFDIELSVESDELSDSQKEAFADAAQDLFSGMDYDDLLEIFPKNVSGHLKPLVDRKAALLTALEDKELQLYDLEELLKNS